MMMINSRTIAHFCHLFLLLSLTFFLTSVEVTLADTLAQGAYWTYEITSKSELQGTGRYEGRFATTIAVAGRGTIRNINTTVLVIEKREKITFSVDGSGYYKQEARSDQIAVTETYTIDRQTLTYRSRTVRNETENKEYQDKSVLGVPATEFVSTSLVEGQQIQYFTFVGKVNCSVSFGSLDFDGSSLPAIVLRCSGPTPRDPWLEANGTADHTFKFEKSTGLLTISSSRIQTTGEKGTRLTTYDYRLNSTSLWTKTDTQAPTPTQTTTPPTTTPTKTPPKTPPAQDTGTVSSGTDYSIMLLLAVVVGALIMVTLKVRMKVLSQILRRAGARAIVTSGKSPSQPRL